jgi:hypothetical protein
LLQTVYLGLIRYLFAQKASSGFWINLLAAPSRDAMVKAVSCHAAFIPSYGGGTAADSNRIPFFLYFKFTIKEWMRESQLK